MNLPLSMPDSDDEEEASDSGGRPTKIDFILSQSGAFKMEDFQIRPQGGLTGSCRDSPERRSHAISEEIDTPQLDVHSISDLEMLNELGSGASGNVFKARHRSTGTFVAVKCVTILEKSKRDQVISELRIMMSHSQGSRWLVKMHNAFYGDASSHLSSSDYGHSK